MKQIHGVVLKCNSIGAIIEVISDSFGLVDFFTPGMLFTRLAARSEIKKALSFLEEIRNQGTAFGWELNLILDKEIKTLHFIGIKNGADLLIAGAENSGLLLVLYEEMMKINNEQTNALRAAIKDKNFDRGLFDEISRLNNELMAIQRELAKKNAELEHLNQEKNRFLGMAAHDLRNPLHNILLASEFLSEENPACPASQYQEFLEVIRTSSQFMVNMVDDLLDVAKIEAGKLNLDYAPEDLPNLVQKNLSRNRALAAKKGITLTLEAAPLPIVVVDAGKVEQVLNNLVGNAIKFSPSGSTIEVRLEHESESFRLSVKDEGPGISAQVQANLFKAFQPGRAGTHGEKSSGLGLVIVKRIVEGHGGRLWLESVEGKGTTFFASMPFLPPPAESG
ncbi:MAG: HAMP domain-containing histidine kinase [Anaerolineae bacterium]|nr:HAMP domain-containing histidine kinase [Anaerolineae bacterium]